MSGALKARGARIALAIGVGAGVFVFDWLLRFNDPGGAFAGLTDDHFFYVVRGWQILFGDLPVRDFVDHGAPLHYYLAAAVQVILGRGTLSVITFTATVVALGAALTFWLAFRAAGSILAGLSGAAFEVLLAPRFYNYPKILMYAAGIWLLWWFADRQSSGRRAALAVVTAIAFLFRHDHGVFMVIATFTLLALLPGVPWQQRVRHGAMYVLVTGALLLPYFLFVQANGGLVRYLTEASAWAERDRGRAPVVWPGVFEQPSDVIESAWPERAIGSIRANAVAWTYYSEIAIPCVALLLLGLWPRAARPEWPHARAKIATVAVLGLVLDAGFLRGPLEARVADPSVPLSILIAWMIVVVARTLWEPSSPRREIGKVVGALRIVGAVAVVGILALIALVLTRDLHRRLDAAHLLNSPGHALFRVREMRARLRDEWNLDTWRRRSDRSPSIDLALYLNACTTPADRVLIEGYLPQVPGLARRAFAGGHADLRPGFSTSVDAQRLTIARLTRQSVPVALFDSEDFPEDFRDSFPLVAAYLDREYRIGGAHTFEEGFGITLLVRRDRQPERTYMPLDWPCFAG